MKFVPISLVVASLLGLAACDRPQPEELPPIDAEHVEVVSTTYKVVGAPAINGRLCTMVLEIAPGQTAQIYAVGPPETYDTMATPETIQVAMDRFNACRSSKDGDEISWDL